MSPIAFLRPCPCVPYCSKNLPVDVAMIPLQPTSTGSTEAFHPRYFTSSIMTEYLFFFLSYDSSTAVSHGTVSSIKCTTFLSIDHKTMSGLRLVVTISCGKTSLCSRSTWRFQSLAPVCKLFFMFTCTFFCFLPSWNETSTFPHYRCLLGIINNIFYLSTISAIWRRTGLCLQVYRP